MESLGQTIKTHLHSAYRIIANYFCLFLTHANEKTKDLMGTENHQKISAFLQKHAFACIFGSMVVAACVFHLKTRRSTPNEITMSSDSGKSKKSAPQKLPEKLKSKIKFASDEEPDEIQQNSQNFTTEPYESAIELKKSKRKSGSKKKKENFQELEQVLDQQVSKSREKIVLEDSKSDKIFNEMYGMYQEALRQ